MRTEQRVEQLVCLAASLRCDYTTPKLIQGDGIRGSESYLAVSIIIQLPVGVSAFEQRAFRAPSRQLRRTDNGYGIYRM